MKYNPFNLPDTNKLNDTNNMFLPKNLNNNDNSKNIFPFPNNTGINNNNSFFNTNNQTNGTINKNNENPFLITQETFKNNPFSNPNSNLSTKPEEKNKNIFPFLGNNDKILKNETKGNIFGSNNINNIVNNANNPFFTIKMNPPNFFKAPDNTISSPQTNLNTQEEKPKIENSTAQINPFNSNNFNPINNNNNKNDLNNGNLISQKIEKEKEKKENNNIFLSGPNKIEKNNFNQFEFSTSPKKQLEIIKEEDEELKLKKESSTLGVLTENIFNNGDNDSQEKLKDKINNKNENIAISNFNNNINKNNESEHKLQNNIENNLNNINEVRKENEINEEKEKKEEKPIINEEKKENEIVENNKKENDINDNIENNNIESNINNEKEINKEEEENNNENDNIIKLEKIINISDNEEEISKIIEENNEHVDNIINEYHLNIITDMIDLNINEFKNKIKQFINFSAEKINDIKILNDICNKIKEKLFINYNIMIEKQNININEYNILKEYDQKLDYVISLQNSIINDLKNVNNELKQNINSFQDENNQNKNEINEKELNDNINNTHENIKNLEIMLENHFNKNAIENLNDINIPDFKENDNFFSVIQSIYTPLKEVNKAFEQILMESSSYDEKNC